MIVGRSPGATDVTDVLLIARAFSLTVALTRFILVKYYSSTLKSYFLILALNFFKGAQDGGRTWDLFSFHVFSLTSAVPSTTRLLRPSNRIELLRQALPAVLAQWLEGCPTNLEVVGSNPAELYFDFFCPTFLYFKEECPSWRWKLKWDSKLWNRFNKNSLGKKS